MRLVAARGDVGDGVCLHLKTEGVDFPAYAAENLGKLDQSLDLFQSKHGKLT